MSLSQIVSNLSIQFKRSLLIKKWRNITLNLDSLNVDITSSYTRSSLSQSKFETSIHSPNTLPRCDEGGMFILDKYHTNTITYSQINTELLPQGYDTNSNENYSLDGSIDSTMRSDCITFCYQTSVAKYFNKDEFYDSEYLIRKKFIEKYQSFKLNYEIRNIIRAGIITDDC